MPISAALIVSARKLRPWAVQQVLENEYPAVYRVACGLAGRADVGRGIARFVLGRSVKMMPKWDPAVDPRNWFYRFTILTSRRTIKHQPDPQRDLLVEKADVPVEAEYVAFVAALRILPRQQIEAFLLHHGERLNERYSAVAMDCSTQAVATHLAAAMDALRAVTSPGKFETFTQREASAYGRLAPDDQYIAPAINRAMIRHYWPRRIWRMIRFLIQVAVLGGIAYAGWWAYQHVRI